MNIFSSKETQVVKDYHKQQNKTVTTVSLQLYLLRMGETSLSQPTCFFSNNFLPFESNAFRFVEKIKQNKNKMREYLNFQQQLEHHPKSMLCEEGIAGTQQHRVERRSLISQWDANQHIWSHWKPESRHVCFIPIQSHPLRVQQEDINT